MEMGIFRKSVLQDGGAFSRDASAYPTDPLKLPLVLGNSPKAREGFSKYPAGIA